VAFCQCAGHGCAGKYCRRARRFVGLKAHASTITPARLPAATCTRKASGKHDRKDRLTLLREGVPAVVYAYTC